MLRSTALKAMRPALGASRRMLATSELPLTPPMTMFGTAGRYAQHSQKEYQKYVSAQYPHNLF